MNRQTQNTPADETSLAGVRFLRVHRCLSEDEAALRGLGAEVKVEVKPSPLEARGNAPYDASVGIRVPNPAFRAGVRP